jgi:hypothetical protein
MITLTILFTLLYGYSIYKIRKVSGSWEDFSPYSAYDEGNAFAYMIFGFGTFIITAFILVLLIYAVDSGIIP